MLYLPSLFFTGSVSRLLLFSVQPLYNAIAGTSTDAALSVLNFLFLILLILIFFKYNLFF